MQSKQIPELRASPRYPKPSSKSDFGNQVSDIPILLLWRAGILIFPRVYSGRQNPKRSKALKPRQKNFR